MNALFRFLSPLILLLSVKSILVYAKCPDAASIKPCECYSETKDVICSGVEIKELKFESLKSGSFGKLWINDTLITQIPDNFLGSSTWNEIIISNNRNLTDIGEKAFQKGPKELLMLSNNKALHSTPLYKMLKYIEETETIQLDGNDIKALPSNALNPNSKIKNFFVHNNLLQRVRENNFLGPKFLTQIRFDHNLIHLIAENGLNFTPNDSNRTIIVLLNDNKLTDSSFNNSTFSSNELITIELDLGNNNLTELREDVFGPFLKNKKNQLYLNDNDFNCDCHMLWLLDNDYRQNNTFSVGCIEQKENLFHLNKMDLKCQPTTTTTTPTPKPTSKPTTKPTATTTTTTTTLGP